MAAAFATVFSLSASSAAAQAPEHPFLPALSHSGFSDPCGLATDAEGDLYVASYNEDVVDVYSPSGGFLTTFTPSANTANPCALAVSSSGDVYVNGWGTDVVKYKPSAYPPTPSITYKADASVGQGGVIVPSGATSVAVDPANQDVYVAEGNHISSYDPAGTLISETIGNGVPGASYYGVDVYGNNGNVYVTDLAHGEAYILNPSGSEVLTTIDGSEAPQGVFVAMASPYLAVDQSTGNVFVSDIPGHGVVDEFDDTGHYVSQLGPTFGEGDGSFTEAEPSDIAVDGSTGSSEGNVYVSSLSGNVYAFGPIPVPPVAPIISAQSVIPLYTEAELFAKVNPGHAETTYFFEYGLTATYGSSTAEKAIPSGHVAVSASGQLVDLTEGAEYHFRLVATNSVGTIVGPDHTFTTRSSSSDGTLPDNRGYEQVSPIDKNGGDVRTYGPEGIEQAATDGNTITYLASTSFSEPKSGFPGAAQYVSTWTPSGWSTRNITGPMRGGGWCLVGCGWPYRAFTSDVSSGISFLIPPSVPTCPGTAPAATDHQNYYLYDRAASCFRPLLTTANTVPDPTPGFGQFFVELLATTPDQRHIVISSQAALTDNAIDNGGENLYEWSASDERSLQLINVLPSETQGTPTATVQRASIAGTHAISDDGSRVFWTNHDRAGSAVGSNLYLREDGTTTVQVDEKVGGGGHFQVASVDGSSVVFTKADGPGGDTSGDLYRYDVESEETTDLAPGGEVLQVIGASDDASYLYFVADAKLTGEDENANGEKAESGRPNLYLSHNDATTFIGTLAKSDGSGQGGFTEDWSSASNGGDLTVGFSPDGSHFAFVSHRSLTGYDNTHAGGGACDASGSACPETFLYDANTGSLICTSCDPTGVQPTGGSSIPQGDTFSLSSTVVNNPRVLSDDGGRFFFDSDDSLSLKDTNGQADVYEWEAQGAGSCHRSGGCIFLISSGTSPKESSFVDASSNGSDAFFTTASQLLPQDNDSSVDLYDARVNGAYPPPSPPPPACNGDACQSPASSPEDPTPASSSFSGPGNPAPASKKNRHKKKHHKRAAGKRHNARDAKTNRRAGK